MHSPPVCRQEDDQLTVGHRRQAGQDILEIGIRIDSPPPATLDHCVQDSATFPDPGHPDVGWRSAVIYSLLITARRYRLDPAAWVSDVLRRIPTCTQANLPELLPWNWKPKAA